MSIIIKDYPEHPSLLFIKGLLNGINMQIKKDPTIMNPRIKNLLDDIIDLDCDILAQTFHKPNILLPSNLKARLTDVIQTSRRLGIYPDFLTPKIPQKF